VGDAREILPGLPAGLVVVDPPYNLGYHYDVYGDRLEKTAYLNFLVAITPEPAVVIHYPETITQLAIARGKAPDKMVAWVYNANTPRQWRVVAWWGIAPDLSLGGQEYKNPTDKRVQALKAKHRVENPDNNSSEKMARLYDWWQIDQVKNISEEKTAHPCQIPVELMARILLVTPYNGPIIDPCMGSGSTLRAAKNLGRPSIGIEISQTYADIAVGRMAQESLSL